LSAEEIVFYVIAAVTVVGGLGTVFSRSIIHAALFLILALLSVAGIFVLMAADFLAVVQVLVYGGAVTILILFSMMLTRVRDLPAAPDGPQKPIALVAAIAFAVTSIAAIASTEFRGKSEEEITVIPFEEIGTALFTTWAIPFEIASLVLMVALIGAIILARGEEGE
jgi:NADH-quinone oxidoreductase subunit J